MRSTFVCLTTITLLLGACPAGDDGDTGAGTDGSTSTDPSTTAPTTTDPATTDPATTDPATTDPATTDPATTDPATTDPSETETDPSETDPTESSGPDPDTGTGETGPSECPPEEDDDACSMCTKENCCPELMACQANKECDCVVACISEMGLGMQDACLEKCGAKEVPEEAGPLQTCVATSGCLQDCL
jgi:hypothetical protein